MADINPSLPIIGQPVSTEDPKILTALSQLVSTINNLDTANLSGSAGILDTQLGSPLSATWRTIAQVPFQFRSSEGSAATYGLLEVGNTFIGGIASNSGVPIYLDPADFAVTGRTPKLRLRVQAAIGGPPGVSFTFGLYPFTVTNSAGTAVLTPGTVVSGSTAGIGTPPGNTKQVNTSTAFSFPSADHYIVAVAMSGTTAASSNMIGRVLLQTNHA